MYVRKITLIFLLSLPFAVLAQNVEFDEPDVNLLREELAETRIQMAEAARRMAEIQRQLLTEQSEMKHAQREILLLKDGELKSLENDLETIKEEIHIETNVVADLIGDYSNARVFGIGDLDHLPPRLGVVLNEGEDGLKVLGLTPGGGAEKAGIQRDDILVSVNGQAVDPEKAGSVSDLLADLKAGDTVPVEVIRDGEAMTFDVVTSSFMQNLNVLVDDIDIRVPGMGGQREFVIMGSDGEPIDFPGLAHAAPFFPTAPILGRETELISNHAGLASYFGTDEGVIVLRIDEENTLNLQSGDVILTVNQESLSRPVDLGRLLSLSGKAGDPVTLEVMRNGVLTQFEGSIPEPMTSSLFGDRLRIRSTPPKVEILPRPEHPGNNY